MSVIKVINEIFMLHIWKEQKCQKCLENDKIVHPKTIKLIRMFYYVDISKIDKIEISDNIKNEINEFVDDYYDRYSGLYLKSKQFLKNITKV